MVEADAVGLVISQLGFAFSNMTQFVTLLSCSVIFTLPTTLIAQTLGFCLVKMQDGGQPCGIQPIWNADRSPPTQGCHLNSFQGFVSDPNHLLGCWPPRFVCTFVRILVDIEVLGME